MKLAQKLKSLVLVTISGTGVFAGVCIYKGNEKFYRNIVMPAVHMLDPETTHTLGIIANKYNLFPKSYYEDPPSLKVNIFGREYSNPVGIAAGFDKQAEAIVGLHQLGFGFVEIGSVTPEPQPGNSKPRVFRLPEDQAVINRYGFNSDGHEKIYQRLESLKHTQFTGIIGVNLGKNKNSPNGINDYVQGIEKFGHVADYLVINISSPNTPGLRTLQNRQMLHDLLSTIVIARNNLPIAHRPPILVKLAPDLSWEEKRDIADVLKCRECQVDGLIVCNTTVERSPELKNSEYVNERGGLSGKPLTDRSTEMIAEMYKLTNGMTIIGVGGVFSGKDAYDKIKAGASLVQVYTAFVYQGPPCATRIKRELAELLQADGYTNVSEAVGVDKNK
ncbi:Dihydroorotate dehydrogenase [Carabus blaptoides fortunei]